MKKSKLFLISIVLLLGTLNSNAQTSLVKILDFNVKPVFPTEDSIQGDTVILRVQFKVKNAEMANELQVWMGTAIQQSDIAMFTGSFLTNQDIVNVFIGGKNYPIENNVASFELKALKQELLQTNSFALIIKDQNNNQLPVLTINK